MSQDTEGVVYIIRRLGALTVGEIAGALGCSRDRAHELVLAAEKAGRITRVEGDRWSVMS